MPRRSVTSALAIAAILALTVSSATMGRSDNQKVYIHDNCDGPSFNEVLGPGACTRAGGMTFEMVIASLAMGGTPSWHFSPGAVKVAAGGTITAINRGGEFHTFTQVEAFGGGCVDEINAGLGLTPVPECDEVPPPFVTSGVPQGGSFTTQPLGAGTHFFQCIIHPWQRSTVTAG